jgi:hypothetical protein
MKKIIILILSVITFASCQENKENYPELNVKHELRKFNVKTTSEKYASGGFFLIMGSYSSGETQKTNCRMYFKNCEGSYQLLDIPTSMVKIHIIDTLTKPYVTLDLYNEGWTCVRLLNMNPGIWYRSVTVYCKESDFQPEININDAK